MADTRTHLETDHDRQVKAAEAAKAAAEAEKFKAEAAKAAAEAEAAQHAATEARIKAEKAVEARDKELTASHYHGQHTFAAGVDATSVKAAVDAMTAWDRLHPDEPYTLLIYSPGGSIVDGFVLWDYLTDFKQRHHLITKSFGYAASMGGVLLQAGHVRQMGKQASLLIHEAAFNASGKVGAVDDTVGWVKAMQQRLFAIYADRANPSTGRPMSAKAIANRCARKDWWLSAEEALKYGFIDEIV